jgi:predicted membrane GTPase involved in stress response
MHYDLPIEQLVRRTDSPFQLGFAHQAREVLPKRGDFLAMVTYKGLRVLATNEDGLSAPVEALRDVYGPAVDVRPPKVRLIEGPQLKEPIMHVRICLENRYVEAVKRALAARGASPSEEYARPSYSVLRYEAPLVGLLGLPREIAGLTAGTARHWIVLSHYALVTRDPGGRAA